MIYERTLAVGQRFSAIVDLILAEQHSTRTLAAVLSLSEPTISRCLAALRRRGYQIEPRRKGQTWCFVLVHEPRAVTVAHK